MIIFPPHVKLFLQIYGLEKRIITMQGIDAVELNFSQDNIFILNLSLGFIMFGVALNLTLDDFRRLILHPKPALVGILSQFFALPLFTFFIVVLFQPIPSIALGMIMVAACPGGNISNFMSATAKGNIALSVSLTAVSSTLAIFLTPINLSLYGSLYEPTNQILQEVSLSFWDVFKTVVIILGIPIILGMIVRHYFENLASRLKTFMQVFSILIFAAIVILAFMANFDLFLEYIDRVILVVFLHNAVALIIGYRMGSLFGLPLQDKRTLAIETGIQNSGLGLLLIFTFFDGLGGMAIVAAWWGIWHILSGLALAYFWNYRKKVKNV